MQTHQSLFVRYIVAGVTTSWQQVHATDSPIPEPVRQQAWHILSFALDVPVAWPMTRTLLLALAPKMEQAGFRDAWIPYLEKGFVCAQAAGDEQTAAECELQLGLLYRLLSRFAEATQWTTASVEHFAVLSNEKEQARALNELAWVEHLQHNYQEATQHIDQALARLKPNDPECAISFRVKGMIAMGQRQWQQAEQFQRMALQIFQQVGDLRKVAWSQQNIGYALSEQGKPEAAIDLYQQASTSLQQLGDRYHWAIIQMNLGVAYYRLGKADLAHSYHLAAAKIFSEVNDKLYKARVETNLGLTYLELKDYKNSYHAFKIAIQLYEVLGDEIWCINAMDGLAMALIADREYDEAIATLSNALARLSRIQSSAYYHNLFDKLANHLTQAQQAQEIEPTSCASNY